MGVSAASARMFHVEHARCHRRRWLIRWRAIPLITRLFQRRHGCHRKHCTRRQCCDRLWTKRGNTLPAGRSLPAIWRPRTRFVAAHDRLSRTSQLLSKAANLPWTLSNSADGRPPVVVVELCNRMQQQRRCDVVSRETFRHRRSLRKFFPGGLVGIERERIPGQAPAVRARGRSGAARVLRQASGL
jgi:hypothetical protein